MTDSTSLRAAVAYLNMLPFFADDSEVRLYDSPQALNHDLTAGRVIAGCSSVIAGLDAGLRVIQPRLGVAAEGDVDSVFIEPIGIANNSDCRSAWERFVVANLSGLKTEMPRAVSGQDGKSPAAPTVTILSSGASAQSLWIVKTLFLAQGYAVSVRIIGRELEQMSVSSIEKCLAGLGVAYPVHEGDLCCLLMIGDPALERRGTFACSEERPSAQSFDSPMNIHRMDVAALWQSYTGLPCVFALWFTPRGDNDERAQAAADRLLAKATEWSGFDGNRKLNLAVNFLKSRKQERLLSVLGHDAIVRYLDNLRFDLSDDSYAQSIATMDSLRQAQMSRERGRHSSVVQSESNVSF
jgi:predicted solute-binding protein